ncbi:MAG: extracellular solute-binding protein [Lachnospiraceae bacterium]|nr:extracellular solute-binding protein [Lachnospiraceae bacterium]
MKKIMRRAAALCAAVIILASGCGSGSEPAAVQDESTVETIEKIQIEIEYDGDEVLGDAIRKAAEGFNESQDIYVASVGSTGINLQELAGDSHSAESMTDEVDGTESAESQQEEDGGIESAESQSEETDGIESVESQSEEAGGTENAEDLSGDSGQHAKSLTASVVFTDDNMAAAYASDYRRLDLRTCQGIESGKNSLYSIIDSLPEHMYETVCDEERGIFYLPVSVTAPVLYYNKTVYDGLGLSLPQTFSQLRDNSLDIYAKYRTPGYLPYDLEGDVVAMMREQEALAAQFESGSESGAEAGDAEMQADDVGTQTGDVGTQTGSSGAQAGNAGAQTGDVSAQTSGVDPQVGNTGTQTASGSTDNSALQQTMTDAEVLQFFAGNCEAGYFRMVQHEASPALDFATGAVAAFAGTPEDYEMATAGVTFDVGTIPWIMDREDAIYWVDTSGMIFFDQGDERNAGAAAFAEYLLRDDVCSEFLESVGGLSPYRTVYESQAYRKNRRGFDEITMAASDEIQRADFVLMSDPKRRELDELLLYIIDKRVTAEDAVRIFAGS